MCPNTDLRHVVVWHHSDTVGWVKSTEDIEFQGEKNIL